MVDCTWCIWLIDIVVHKSIPPFVNLLLIAMDRMMLRKKSSRDTSVGSKIGPSTSDVAQPVLVFSPISWIDSALPACCHYKSGEDGYFNSRKPLRKHPNKPGKLPSPYLQSGLHPSRPWKIYSACWVRDWNKNRSQIYALSPEYQNIHN